jgi:hypothetical protein
MSQISERLDTTDNSILEIRDELATDLADLFKKFAELSGQAGVADGIRRHASDMQTARADKKVKKELEFNSSVFSKPSNADKNAEANGVKVEPDPKAKNGLKTDPNWKSKLDQV